MRDFFYPTSTDSFVNLFTLEVVDHAYLDRLDAMELDHKEETKTPSFITLMEWFPTARTDVKRKMQARLKNIVAEMELAELSGDVPPHLIAKKKELLMRIAYLTPSKRDSAYPLTAADIETARAAHIRDYISVNRAHKALCLFHTDKEPSMHVYDNKYHCFACGTHGSVVDIIMKLYSCTFKQAVEKILNR
jgi:CHC2 zinc finger